jgi:hypothetical protein
MVVAAGSVVKSLRTEDVGSPLGTCERIRPPFSEYTPDGERYVVGFRTGGGHSMLAPARRDTMFSRILHNTARAKRVRRDEKRFMVASGLNAGFCRSAVQASRGIPAGTPASASRC